MRGQGGLSSEPPESLAKGFGPPSTIVKPPQGQSSKTRNIGKNPDFHTRNNRLSRGPTGKALSTSTFLAGMNSNLDIDYSGPLRNEYDNALTGGNNSFFCNLVSPQARPRTKVAALDRSTDTVITLMDDDNEEMNKKMPTSPIVPALPSHRAALVNQMNLHMGVEALIPPPSPKESKGKAFHHRTLTRANKNMTAVVKACVKDGKRKGNRRRSR